MSDINVNIQQRAENFAAAGEVDGNVYKAALLDYHYSRRAESTIGEGKRYRFAKGIFGTSNLVTKNPKGGWDIKDIPLDFKVENLLTKFSTVDMICGVEGSTITANIVFDDKQVEQGVSYDFNTLVMVDDDGKAFSVIAVQQDTLFKRKAYSIYCTFEQGVA